MISSDLRRNILAGICLPFTLLSALLLAIHSRSLAPINKENIGAPCLKTLEATCLPKITPKSSSSILSHRGRFSRRTLGIRPSLLESRNTVTEQIRRNAYFKDFISTLREPQDEGNAKQDIDLDFASKNKLPSVESELRELNDGISKIAPSEAKEGATRLNNASGCLWKDVDGGRVYSPDKFPVILVLPGFGNDQSDYVEMIGSQISLTGALTARGFRATVLPIERVEWFNVARGLLSLDFWRSKSLPSGPGYSWYINRINETITELLSHIEEEHVVLVAHSAGGWLARAYLSERPEDHRVSALVTLGTPHQNEGGTDVTRGVLPYLNQKFPGACFNDVRCISVAGRAIQGSKDSNVRKSAKAAFAAYHQVCGKGSVYGDGVVPLASAHLPGARQVTLDGVWHSIDKADSWYGSDGNVDLWLRCLCEECDDVCEPEID